MFAIVITDFSTVPLVRRLPPSSSPAVAVCNLLLQCLRRSRLLHRCRPLHPLSCLFLARRSLIANLCFWRFALSSTLCACPLTLLIPYQPPTVVAPLSLSPFFSTLPSVTSDLLTCSSSSTFFRPTRLLPHRPISSKCWMTWTSIPPFRPTPSTTVTLTIST